MACWRAVLFYPDLLVKDDLRLPSGCSSILRMSEMREPEQPGAVPVGACPLMEDVAPQAL